MQQYLFETDYIWDIRKCRMSNVCEQMRARKSNTTDASKFLINNSPTTLRHREVMEFGVLGLSNNEIGILWYQNEAGKIN